MYVCLNTNQLSGTTKKKQHTRSDQSAHVRAIIGEGGGVAHALFSHIRLHNIHGTVTVLVPLHNASGAYRRGEGGES